MENLLALFTPAAPVLEALGAGNLRAVGGSVRAWLRKEPLAGNDVDLATPLTPTEVERLLQHARIRTSDEGRRWGTITAHLEGGPIEITTLRADTYTPGSRYPTVVFTTSWEEDAKRRDFTFNAISVTPEGEVYDPFDGAADLKNNIVKFIGEPLQRLSEDPLRLMRFWRFCGLYGLGGVTPELIETFHLAAPALATVSRARRMREWEKLLQTPQSQTVLTELERHNLLTALNPAL